MGNRKVGRGLAMVKHDEPKSLEEERVYFMLQGTVHCEEKPEQELKAGTWRKELKQRPRKGAAY